MDFLFYHAGIVFRLLPTNKGDRYSKTGISQDLHAWRLFLPIVGQ
jgi:hypothetical protein